MTPRTHAEPELKKTFFIDDIGKVKHKFEVVYVSDLIKVIEHLKKWVNKKSPHTEQETDGYIAACNDIIEYYKR